MDQLSTLVMMFANRWTSGLAGWAVASALIWYVLPIVPAFRDPVLRLGIIVLLLVLCLAVNVVASLRRRHVRRKLEAAVAGGGAGPDRIRQERNEDVRAEVAALETRMREALDRLGRHGRNLYERPWYVMIGPPGAGKTTALLQSGLHFPLAREIASTGGTGSVGGVGGTRLCDWWFADEAVLIDTAGRYTTQDSAAEVDRAGWLGFLDLLRRARPRQPINGVLVVLSVSDFATTDEVERRAHARAVRHRIDELTDRLRLRVPVYLLLSKADRLAGFDAFFDDLDQTAREQVWGTTFDPAEAADAFGDAFANLVARLEQRLVERLQAERSAERRALIATFPSQVASLAAPIEDFLHEAFGGSRIDPAPWLRGVYLTSATQEGTPIDRLTGLLAHSFGIDQARTPALRPDSRRAYFVTALIRDVVLGEALLVRDRPGRARNRRALRIGGFATIAAVTVAALVLLWRSGEIERTRIDHQDELLAAYRQSLSGLALDPVTSDDLPAAAAALDQGRALGQQAPGEATIPLGLSQAAKLGQTDRIAREHVLQRVLLPQLLWRLEDQMRARFGEPDFLYEATRVYLMLGSEGPLDRSLVRSWMTADWESRFPGTLNAALRDRLGVDLDELLASPLPPVALDGALVEAARATFSRVSLAKRIYSRIRADAAASTAVPDWSPAAALGPLGARLFTRPSGAPLTDAIPGMLTAAGERDEIEQALPATTRAVASESWVLGHTDAVPADGPHLAALEAQVEMLWVADAERAWDALLGDLALAPFGTHGNAVQVLYVLGSPQSPMRDLLVAVAAAVTIKPPPSAPAADGAGGRQALSALFASDAATDAMAAMNQHYAPLTSLVTGPAPLPIDNILRLVNALQSEVAAAEPGAASLPRTLQNGGDPAASLLAETERQPAPVSVWLRQIAALGNAALGNAAHQAAAAAFGGDRQDSSASDSPQALCHAVVDGHYPFESKSGDDASVDDFSRLFSPGGALDAYFLAEVKPYVDTSSAIWRPHALAGVAAPVDAASVASFQRAAAIRDAFFAGGGAAQIRFTLRPLAGNTSHAVFALGATTLATDAADPVTFTWPLAAGASTASVRFPGKKNADAAPALTERGSWALFRLLADASREPGGEPVQFDYAFRSETAHADFELTAGSAFNPFGQNLLTGFKCPMVR